MNKSQGILFLIGFVLVGAVATQGLPASFHWGNVNNTNFLGTTKNQHLPHYCQSGWAFAATSSISDRIAILRGGHFPEIDLSPQVLLTCNLQAGGCNGDTPLSAYSWMAENNITDSSCAPYQALCHNTGLTCNATSICKECNPNGSCYLPKFFNNYTLDSYGSIPSLNTQAIQQEIFNNGPVSCGIDASSLSNFTGSGVITTSTKTSINHYVSVVGWGVTTDGQNTPYWVIRNSWGEYWGNEGYAYILRGSNTLFIEQSCSFGIPKDTWDGQAYPHAPKPRTAVKTGAVHTFKEFHKKFIKSQEPRLHRNCYQPRNSNEVPLQVVTSPQPSEMPMAVPQNFWWGNVDGVNYLSWTINQHLPQYCGSCWAQAGTSSITDRIHIQRNNIFPRVSLAVQTVINCYGGGSCNGGNTDGPYLFAYRKGIPEMGCQVYEALNPAHFSCSPEQNCMNCGPGTNNCWAVKTFKKWRVSQFGMIKGPDAMKKEIFARGPISCGIMATNKLEAYTGGIFSEKSLIVSINHVISVGGWGVDSQSGEEYWIVRNSWGTHYGENGYFRIKMGSENLGIDSHECWWGVPDQEPSFEAITE